MIKLSDIEISKSIKTGYLNRKQNWLNFIDRIIIALIFIGLMISVSLFFLEIDLHNPKDQASFFVILLPVVFLFAAYGLYRSMVSNQLICIETIFDKNKNDELLRKFLNEFHYEIYRSSQTIILVNDENELSFNGLWSKMITFIIIEGKIYFNIQTLNPIINPPIFIAHLILKHDLKKFIKKYQHNY